MLKQIVVSSILFILVLFTTNIFAQNLTDEQKNALLPNIKLLLKDYERYSQFSTDGVRLNNDYITQFSGLFESKINGIYNDLTPAKKGTFSSVDQYISFVKTNYQQGLDILLDIDNLRIVDAQLENDTYTINVIVHKKITGIFNNQEIYRFNDDLYFTLTAIVNEQGGSSNFKIGGVSKEGYAQAYAKKSGKTVSIGISAIYSRTKIYSSTFYSSDIWKATSGNAIYPGLDVTIMFTDGFGVGTGVRFSSYKSSFAISGYNRTSDATLTDIDGDRYNPVLNIPNLNERKRINALDIPILTKFIAGKSKSKFYFDFGFLFSIISKSYFTLEGSSVRAGYYPTLNVTLEDIPEYGFGSFTYTTSKKYEMEMSSYCISGFAMIGLQHQLSPVLSLDIGVGFNYGLTDIGFDKKSPENYFTYTMVEPDKKTTLKSTGVRIGLSYKIPFKH